MKFIYPNWQYAKTFFSCFHIRYPFCIYNLVNLKHGMIFLRFQRQKLLSRLNRLHSLTEIIKLIFSSLCQISHHTHLATVQKGVSYTTESIFIVNLEYLTKRETANVTSSAHHIAHWIILFMPPNIQYSILHRSMCSNF